ncbi:MAG: hypothetical protein DME25_03135 [Verrucomicrobia bacterium]|nr:MAG: hypothetical protein DME25_03135 [Verrucomicrobiota bacterium]
MPKSHPKLKLSFSAKVLVPVLTIMVLLLGVTVWLVNHRIAEQSQAQGARSLGAADWVFRHSQKSHRNDLLARYRNLPNEPRYKSLFQQLHAPTLNEALGELLGEHQVEVILFATDQRELLAHAKRDPLISISEFQSASAAVVKLALQGDEKVDTIRVGERLFDVVAIPVFGTGDYLIGALTLGSEIGSTAAQELREYTQCHVALLADGRVIASTLRGRDLHEPLAQLFRDGAVGPSQHDGPAEVSLGGEHYFCSAGKFDSLSGDNKLGYLLLSSYEEPWRALQSTRQMLLLASGQGLLLSAAIIWLLVRRAARPLRALSVSAEAVGRGDFSRRVQVTSRDECGELAAAFNHMTENLQRSRQELESTVQTLKTTQAQLVQSEKLSSIGEFVAGVAHELNNPLTSVMGFSELLKRSDTDPKRQRHLDLIHKSAQRCQKIVQSLLSFARRHTPERKLSNLNELVSGAVDFLQYQLRTSNVEVALRLDPHLPRTMVDPHQLQQVFLNILNNGRQAIENHQPKGCLHVSTETCGQNARIIFQDNGPGIPEENLSKVFDPFFTTKEVGKGTGLGLSICYGIIREHGGTITVSSQPGQGARFVIELPLAAGPEPDGQSTETARFTKSNGHDGRGKRVLVIDDEEAILQMVRDILSQNGYQVDVANDGESALRRLDQTAYDLALCDWKMPGLNGEQVYERIRSAHPALSERMIFITGDVMNPKAEKFLRERQKLCLSKPFSLSEFRSAVGKALSNS